MVALPPGTDDEKRGGSLLKHFRLWGVLLFASCIFLLMKMECLAVQCQYTPLEKLPKGADASDFIRLGVQDERYEVKPGDTLWGISRQFFGTGTKYEEIWQENRDSIEDASLLLPGEVLTLSLPLYIPRDRYDRGGLVYEGGFHIAKPDMVEHQYFLTTSNLDDGDFFGSDIRIFSLPVTNHMGENALTATEHDWEAFVAEVKRCSEECGGRVSNLVFEKYTVENGCDLCGYSFDFDTGEAVMEYVVFYRLGERNMAEVIGKREKEEGKPADGRLLDVTRYIAASFEDFGGRIGMGYTKMADNVGAWDWDYPELHNLFTSAMEDYVVYAKRPDQNYPDDHEIIWTEPMLEEAVRNALTALWQLTEEESAAFQKRPLMASDMAVITEVDCTQYDPWSRPVSDDPLAKGGPVIYLNCNGHLEKIYLDKDSSFAYEDLGYFTEAEKFSVFNIKTEDLSFIANMTHLKELSLYMDTLVEDIGFLSELKELRLLQLLGAYVCGDENPAGFLKITDLSVLANCGELRYLYLYTPLVTDYSFLKSCPEICTIMLSGEWSGKEPVIPDLGLVPNARFLEFYGESYRFDP